MKTIRSLFIIFLLLMAVGLVFAQDDVLPEVTPTLETDVGVEQPPIAAGNTMLDWLQFAIDNELHWYLFAFITVIFVGNLVPQSEMQKRRESARQTETPVDDAFWTFLDMVQAFKRSMPATVPALPIPPANTPSANFPSVLNPSKPIGTTKYLAPYEMRLDMPEGRQIHVPVNMAYYFSNKDGIGKEYPHPNVNVNNAYGARFDIAHIAGEWGFTLMFTPDKDVKYKVTVDYSAQVTGQTVSTLSDWLWWTLLLDHAPGGNNIGISNGARHEASWVIEGTGVPMMITPCIHAQWASAGDTSVIEWHNLTITPIE